MTGGGTLAYVEAGGDDADNDEGGGGTGCKVPIFFVSRDSMLPLKGILTAGTDRG